MSDVPFIAIGNDELGEPVGDSVTCRTCGEQHAIEFGTSRRMLDDGTWSEPEPSNLLGFYKCGDGLFLASLNGRAVP